MKGYLYRIMFMVFPLALAVNFLVFPSHAGAQDGNGFTLSGKIYNSATRQPVEFGTVIIMEARRKAYTRPDGSYTVTIPEAGEYTIVISSEGLKPFKGTVVISGDMRRDYRLMPLRVQGATITIRGKRDLQKVSRHTMDREQMKGVPASFGDAITALTSLPGVDRTFGDLFGNIVIRGGNPFGSNFFVDDIPIQNPYHFGGFHAVINSNLLDEVDLFASAFPAEYGYATCSLINMHTVDDVKDFGGYADLSLISFNVLVQDPILRDENGKIHMGSPLEKVDPKKYKNAGYIIASGRIGYFNLIIEPLIELIEGENVNTPEYWDYQFKAKYYLNSSNSLTALFFGYSDLFEIRDNSIVQELKDGDDPLTIGFSASYEKSAHGQGLYYIFEPNERFRNKITVYASLMATKQAVDFPLAAGVFALQNLKLYSRPYVFGVKEKFKGEVWKDRMEIRGGVEGHAYQFTAKGKSFIPSGNDLSGDVLGNPELSTSQFLRNRIINYTAGAYLEVKFFYKGLTILPGFRTDFLRRTREITWDPRGLISYEAPWGMTFSVAGGKYSYFFQTSPLLFDTFPQVSKIGRSLVSEHAWHHVAGIEQDINDKLSIKLEGYYNRFYNIPQAYYHIEADGRPLEGLTTGKIRTYGVEILFKVDKKENERGVFGWMSYAWNRSRFRSGLPIAPGLYSPVPETLGYPTNSTGDPFGRQWIPTDSEQEHTVKVVAGYDFGNHMITSKFQFYTSRPYTPIVWYEQDTSYVPLYPGDQRYIPIYGYPNSERFEPQHRLDIRYTFKKSYTWGQVSWYAEVINVLNYLPKVIQSWDYRFPYIPGRNPKITRPNATIAFFPNFGVEVKF